MDKKYFKFGLVGIFNTLFNLLLFNFFIFALGMSVGAANVASLLISILISFFLNQRYVFQSSGGGSFYKTFAGFMAVSLFTQLIVQQVVVTLFVYHLTGPGELVYAIAKHLPSFSGLPKRFYLINTAKIIAVGASLVTNYVLYDKLVFAPPKKPAIAEDK